MLGRGRCPQRSGGTEEPPPPNSCRQRSWRCWVPGPQERLQDVHSPASQLWLCAGRGRDRATGGKREDDGAAMCGGWGPSEERGMFSIGVGVPLWGSGCWVSFCLWTASLANRTLSLWPGDSFACRVRVRPGQRGCVCLEQLLCSQDCAPPCGSYSLWGAWGAVAGFQRDWGSGAHSTAALIQFLSRLTRNAEEDGAPNAWRGEREARGWDGSRVSGVPGWAQSWRGVAPRSRVCN